MVSINRPSVKCVSIPVGMTRQVTGRSDLSRTDDELQVRLIERRQIGRREHPGMGDHDGIGEVVAGLGLLDCRHGRAGLGMVSVEAVDLHREPLTGDEETDHNLRFDPALICI
jgi:hypothetical protein